MPTYEVTLSDGRTLEVDANAPPSMSDIQSHLSQTQPADPLDRLSPAAMQARMDASNAAAKAAADAPSMLGSFGREAARSFGPGLAGMATGAASGAALGAAGLNPITVGIGGVVGGITGFMATRAGQDKLVDAIAPDSFMGTKSAEQDFATNKWSSMLGGAVGGGGAPGPLRAVGALTKMLTADGRQILVQGLRPGADALAQAASKDIMEPLVAGGVGAGLGVMTGTGPQDVAEQAGLGILFNRGWTPKAWHPQFGHSPASTDSQHGAQGDPATGLPPGGGSGPIETNAAVVTPMQGDGLVPSGPTRLAADLARQFGIDPNALTPSGAGGTVTPNDVRRAGANLPARTIDSGGTVDLTPARKPSPTLSDLIGRDTEWQGHKGKLIDDQGRPALELPGGEVVELPFNFHTERSIADLGIVPTGDRVADRHAATRLFGDTEGDAMTQVFSHIDTQTDNVIDIAELGASMKRQGTGHVPVRDTPEFAQHARGVTDESILAAHDQITAALAAAESHPNLSNDTRTAIADKLRGDIDNLTALSAARDAWQRERVPLPVGSPEIPSQRATLAATASGDNRAAAVRELNRQSPAPIPVAPENNTNPQPLPWPKENQQPLPPKVAEKAANAAEPVTPVAEVVPKPPSAPETRPGVAPVELTPAVVAPEMKPEPPAPVPLEPLKGAPHLAQGRVDRNTAMLAKLEAAGKGDTPQALKLRANIDKETAQIAAAGGVPVSQAKQLQARVDAVHDSGDVVVQDHTKFGTQHLDPNQEITISNKGAEEVTAGEHARAQDVIPQRPHDDSYDHMTDHIDPDPVDPTPAKPAAEDLVLKAHADDAEIKAEAAAQAEAARVKAETPPVETDAQKIARLKAQRLTGTLGDTTADMFDPIAGETPLFNKRHDTPPTPAESKSLIAGLKAHQQDVENWIKGEKRSGRLNSMPIDIMAADAWNVGLKVGIKVLETGASIPTYIKTILTHFRETRAAANERALTKSEERRIANNLNAIAKEQLRYQGERDEKFMREMPRIAQEMAAATGNDPTLPGLIEGMVKRFPDNEAYIRKNGEKIFKDMLFSRDVLLSRTTEKARAWGEWADASLEGVSHYIDGLRKGATLIDLRQFATKFHATWFTGIGNGMRWLGEGGFDGRESKAFQKFSEGLVGLAKGADGTHRVSTDLAMHLDLTRVANKLTQIRMDLAPILNKMPRRERGAFLERVGDHVCDASRDAELVNQPEMRKAVEAIVAVRQELLAHMKDAGVQVGDAGGRTLRRVLDRSTVLSNENEFLKQTTHAYKAKWRREIAVLNAEAATLDPLKNKARLTSIAAEIKEISARDAADSAKKNFHAIQAEDVGITSDGNDLFTSGRGNPSMLKSREFGPEADQLLGKFYVRDPFAILRNEVGDAMRAAGVAKTFSGPKLDAEGKPMANGEIDPMAKWKALRSEMIAEGNEAMIAPAATFMKEYFNLGGQDNPAMRKVMNFAHTHAQLAFLARATFSSMGEPALATIRAGGGLKMLAGNYAETVKGMYREIRYLAPNEARILSDAIGASASGFDSILASNRFLDDYAGHGKGGELVAMFHEKTWLTALTNATHSASIKIAHSFIRSQLQLREAGGKYKATAGRNLNEVGIAMKDAPAMLKFSDEFAASKDKLGMLTADTPEAKMYRDALHLFKNSGGSLESTRSVRPQYANTPAGSMFYALQTFLFAFQDQVIARHARLLRSAYRGETIVDGVSEKMSGAERAKIVGNTLQGVATIMASQYAIQKLRETLYGDPAQAAKTKTLTPSQQTTSRALQILSRSNVMGGYDVLFNIALGARYKTDPATRVLGPSGGALTSLFGQGVQMATGQTSPNTNTAERKLVRGLYGAGVAPLVNAGIATMPGAGMASALVQLANHPAAREAVIRGVAGPPMIQGGGASTRKGPMRLKAPTLKTLK